MPRGLFAPQPIKILEEVQPVTRLLLLAWISTLLIQAEVKPALPPTRTAQLALELQEQGHYDESVRLFKEALVSTAPGSYDEARLLNRLGSTYQDLGNYFEADRAYRHSLRILRTAGPEAHDLTASTLNNLGSLYVNTGKLESARQALREALEIREELTIVEDGAGWSSVAPLLSNLGGVERELGAYDRAVELYQRSLSICRREGCGGSFQEAAILNNLSATCHDRGDFNEAAALLEEALEIWDSPLRRDHPIVGAALTNLAAIRLEQDRPEAAAAVEEGLRILNLTLPENHPRIGAGLSVYSKVLRQTGHRRAARRVRKQAQATLSRNRSENMLDHTIDISALRKPR